MAPQIQPGLTDHPIPVDPPPHPIPIDPLPVLPPRPTPTPVMTPTMVLFLTKLAASKAAGVAAIRLSLLNNGGHQVEELNSEGETIVGFVLYAVGNASKKNVTGVAVLQMGSGNAVSPFTPAQRSAWGLIRDELTQFRTSIAVQPPAGGTGRKVMADSDGRLWFEIGLTFLACAGAIAEGGLNPITDAGCVGGVVDANWGIYEMNDDDPGPENAPVLDIPPDPEPIGPVTQSAPDDPPPPPPDGGGSGGDGGAGGGGGGGGGGTDVGPGDDNGSTHQED